MKIRNQSQPKITRRMTAFLLFFSMLLPIFTVFPSYALDEVAEPIGENTAAELAPIETEDQVFARLTADSQVLNYLDETAFRAAGHVNRLPLEEDLNSYVFENEDGTRTAYILAEPVKYIDNTGTVQEKNLSLSSSSIVTNAALAQPVDTSAYTVTATDTPMTFPADLSQGVRFTYKNYTVTLRPETIGENTLFMQLDGKAIYHNAFGSTAHLVYTPTNTGMKEDILLVREGNVNTFSFILNTDGLIPAEDAGGWYLWDGISNTRQLRLGQVISYDANGDFSVGEMAVTPNGGTTYRVTLTVDPTFLEDATYPVTVDPSIQISGSNALEEITVFTNQENVRLNGEYAYVGYYNTAYGYARTILRAKGLKNNATYQALSPDSILSCNLHFHNADPSVSGIKMNVYRNQTTDWIESTSIAGSINIDFSEAGTPCTFAGGLNWSSLDITDIVGKWKDGTWSLDAGLAMVVKDEGTATRLGGFIASESTTQRPYFTLQYASIETGGPGGEYIEIGTSVQLIANTLPSSVIQWDVLWTSLNTDIATIDRRGRLTGISEGCVRVCAKIYLRDEEIYTTAYRDLYVVPLIPGTYYFCNVENGKYTDQVVDPNNLFPSSKDVFQNEFTNDSTQQWIFNYQKSTQTYTISSFKDTAYYLKPDNNGIPHFVPAGTITPDKFWKIEKGIKGRIIKYYNDPSLVLSTSTSSTTNNAPLICRTYSTNTEYTDEWYITKIPISGGELAYEPTAWNDTYLEYRTNCYAYALNAKEIAYNADYPSEDHPYYKQKMQIGQSQGIDFPPLAWLEPDDAGQTMVEYVELDSEAYGFTFESIGKYEICDPGCYKVALVLDYYESEVENDGCDFHWYRQNPDGTWSHKLGGKNVRCVDASGRIIYDPEIADRNYAIDQNYTAFIGYFQVTPICSGDIF